MFQQGKFVLLDLGGVVFQSTGISNQRIDWPTITQLNAIYGFDLNIGKDRFPQFIRDYNQRTGQALRAMEFLKELFDTLAINTELIELIRHKREIIIVSDNYRENIQYISKRYDFNSWSIQQIYSFDYEMEKSNPLFFQRLLKDNHHLSIENIVFIDDSLSKIKSAATQGIQGILFKDNTQLKEELENYGW